MDFNETVSAIFEHLKLYDLRAEQAEYWKLYIEDTMKREGFDIVALVELDPMRIWIIPRQSGLPARRYKEPLDR